MELPQPNEMQIPAPYAATALNQAAPEKPRIWTVFLAFVTIVVISLVASGFYLGIAAVISGGITGDPHAKVKLVLENPNIMIPSFAVVGMTMLVITAICCALGPERVWDRVSLRSNRLGLQGYVAGVVLVYGTSIAAGQLIRPFADTNSPALKLIDKHLRSADGFMIALGAAIIAVLAPVAEEVFFRGYMQTRLRRRWGPTWAIGITALAFGVLHADPVHTPFAIAMGVAFGYVAERSGSIRPAIAGHIFNNMIAVIATRLPESVRSTSTSWPTFVVGVVVSALGVVWIRRIEAKQAADVR